MAGSPQEITRKRIIPCEAYTKLNLSYIKYRRQVLKLDYIQYEKLTVTITMVGER